MMAINSVRAWRPAALSPDWFGPLLRRHSAVLDWLPPVLLLVLSIPDLFRGDHGWLIGLAGNLVLVAPLIARRSYPIATFVVTGAIAGGLWTFNIRAFGFVSLLVAFYTLASRRPRSVTLIAAAVLEVGNIFAVARWSVSSDWIVAFVLLSGMVCAAGVLGAYTKTRAAYLEQLRERADRVERDRDQQVRLAAVTERSRIAREMHDVVAHHLTVMVALSDGAGATIVQSPAQAAEVMAMVSDTGRRALADTRRLLGVLREEPSDVGGAAGNSSQSDSVVLLPQPDIASLDALLDQVRVAGLPTVFSASGTRPTLPDALELTVYRLVQEALTNSLKHAGPGTHARVSLRYHADAVQLSISDDGAGTEALVGKPAGADSDSPGGLGLPGMRERVAAWSGELASGPLPSGGWSTRAVLRWDGLHD